MNRLISFFKRSFTSQDQKVDVSERCRIKLMGEPGTGSQRNYQDGKSVIPVTLKELDISKYRASDIRINDNIEPISYGGDKEYRIWFLCGLSFVYAVEMDRHFYTFDIREVVKGIDMPNPEGDIENIIADKRKWLTGFLGELAMKEYFLDFRVNDVD